MDAPEINEPPFFVTELPAGYKRLKAGDKRPKGYLFRGKTEECGWIHGGAALVGEPLTKNNLEHMEFAAPTMSKTRVAGTRPNAGGVPRPENAATPKPQTAESL